MADIIVKQKNVPELRFPEYQNEWKKTIFDDIFNERKEKTDDLNLNPIYSLTVESGLTHKTDRYNREYLVKRKNNYKIVKKDDIVFNPMNITLGAIDISKTAYNIVVSGYYNVLIPKKNIHPDFIAQYLSTHKMINHFKRIATGSLKEKQRVHYSEFKKIKRGIPTLKEQQKIGDFFNKLDRRIELEGQKLALLEEQKKGYMQKVFSQELRFKDRHGDDYPDWKEEKLDYLIEVSNKKSQIQDEYPVLTSSRNGLFFQSDYYKDGKTFGSNNIGYFIFPKEYITYRSRSDDGKFTFNINNIIEKGLISKYYPVFKGTKIDTSFLLLVLNYSLKRQLKRIAIGTSQLVLSINELTKLYINIPIHLEQEKISNFFQKVEQRIEMQTQKVNLLKKQKQGFLQKMFI